jgi:hypothetical protein
LKKATESGSKRTKRRGSTMMNRVKSGSRMTTMMSSTPESWVSSKTSGWAMMMMTSSGITSWMGSTMRGSATKTTKSWKGLKKGTKKRSG